MPGQARGHCPYELESSQLLSYVRSAYGHKVAHHERKRSTTVGLVRDSGLLVGEPVEGPSADFERPCPPVLLGTSQKPVHCHENSAVAAWSTGVAATLEDAPAGRLYIRFHPLPRFPEAWTILW